MMHDIGTLKDRKIFFVGVNTGYITDGVPDSRYLKFYKERSSSQIHCVIVGNVVVPSGYGSNASSPTLTNEGVWATIASTISDNGSLPGIQLSTTWHGYVGARKFVSTKSQQVLVAARQLIFEMGREKISAVFDAFEKAARMAVEHGFRHVQLHGAHGYLLSLLIDNRINPDAEQAIYRLASLAKWLTSEAIESSIRVSMRTGDVVFDTNGMITFRDKIASLPFDYIDLSSGFYNIDKRLIYPSRPEILKDRLNESCEVATHFPQKQFIFSGRALQNSQIELPPNLHIGLCRDLIANPHYLNEPEKGCQNSHKCHYFSRGEHHLVCEQWKQNGTS